MQIIIDISNNDYEYLKKTSFVEDEKRVFEQTAEDRKSTMMLFRLIDSVKNGTPLPKEHGRLIDADALDEAIKHCEEVAKELEEEAVKGCCDDSEIMDKCLECAKEHRQLAEWLRALKEIWDSGDCNDCLHQNNCTIRPKPGQLARFNCYQYERGIQIRKRNTE